MIQKTILPLSYTTVYHRLPPSTAIYHHLPWWIGLLFAQKQWTNRFVNKTCSTTMEKHKNKSQFWYRNNSSDILSYCLPPSTLVDQLAFFTKTSKNMCVNKKREKNYEKTSKMNSFDRKNIIPLSHITFYHRLPPSTTVYRGRSACFSHKIN